MIVEEAIAYELNDPAFKGQTLRANDNPSVGGVKADAGKVRFDLLPPEPVRGVAEVLTFGARKYAERNWEKGMDWSRPFGALQRHLWAWWEGEDRDPETGYPHLWHAATNIFFLIAYQARGVGKDDRVKIGKA